MGLLYFPFEVRFKTTVLVVSVVIGISCLVNDTRRPTSKGTALDVVGVRIGRAGGVEGVKMSLTSPTSALLVSHSLLFSRFSLRPAARCVFSVTMRLSPLYSPISIAVCLRFCLKTDFIKLLTAYDLYSVLFRYNRLFEAT